MSNTFILRLPIHTNLSSVLGPVLSPQPLEAASDLSCLLGPAVDPGPHLLQLCSWDLFTIFNTHLKFGSLLTRARGLTVIEHFLDHTGTV